MVGNDSSTSTARISRRSAQPPLHAASAPSGTPPTMARPTDTKPMVSEMRAPQIVRESTSRPRLSVPKRWTRDGACRLLPSAMASGSNGASHGAASAARAKARATVAPKRAPE